jgi:hypothetical protein
MSSPIKRFDLLADFLALSHEEWLMLMGRMEGTVPRWRIVPGPAITPLTDFGRILYARTGQRQWIVAPTLELLD